MKNTIINFVKSEKGKKITTGIIKGAAVVGIYAIAWVGIQTTVSVTNDCYDKVGKFVDKLVERNKKKANPDTCNDQEDDADSVIHVVKVGAESSMDYAGGIHDEDTDEYADVLIPDTPTIIADEPADGNT